MSSQRVFDPCAMMASAIEHIKEEIKSLERRLEGIETEKRRLEAELVTARAQLNAFEEEYSASCRP